MNNSFITNCHNTLSFFDILLYSEANQGFVSRTYFAGLFAAKRFALRLLAEGMCLFGTRASRKLSECCDFGGSGKKSGKIYTGYSKNIFANTHYFLVCFRKIKKKKKAKRAEFLRF